MDYFGTNIPTNDTAVSNLDLTASEIVTSMVPVMIGMIVVGLICCVDAAVKRTSEALDDLA